MGFRSLATPKSARQAIRSMSREAVYWLMSLKAEGLSFLAYDDSLSIAMLRIDDALYEVSYADVEACMSTPPDRLVHHLKQLGALISGLSVKSADLELQPPTYPLEENQTDRRVG